MKLVNLFYNSFYDRYHHLPVSPLFTPSKAQLALALFVVVVLALH